jgi:glycine C-acetyltransferase
MKEDAALLNYGYQGMVSIIDALCSRHDVIVYDAESHACIVDGVRLHPGQRYVFKHNDVEDLEKQLQRAAGLIQKQKTGGILVITEGVFGMAGDQGKLKEITALKDKYQFRLLVDDAHGFGTLGKTGAGAGEEQGIQDKIDLYFQPLPNPWHQWSLHCRNRNIIDYITTISAARSSPRAFHTSCSWNLKRLNCCVISRVERSMEQRIKLKGLKARGDIGKTDSLVTLFL